MGLGSTLGWPSTERDLSSRLGADGSAVRAVLRGLRDEGVVLAQPVRREGSLWGLAPGVRLTYRPPQCWSREPCRSVR